MTEEEVLLWCAYRNKRGSLNLGRRIEQAFGNFTATYLVSKGAKNVNALDFMLYETQTVEDVISADEAFEISFN